MACCNHYLFSCAIFILQLASAWSTRATSECKDVQFEVTATAENRIAQQPLPNAFQNFSSILDTILNTPVKFQTVSGKYKIYGQYCEPSVKHAKPGLQVLVHGLTYSHLYWNGFETLPIPRDPTSWVSFANQQGYATLAIDRLGVGNSDRPDPLQAVQQPLQVEIVHQLIQLLRGNGDSGKIDLSTAWQNIIYVGHSFGSSIGTTISAKYPDDVDALILTAVGVGRSSQSQLLSEYFATHRPAAEADPEQFAGLDADYVIPTGKKERQNIFYTPRSGTDFDPTKYSKDFVTRQTTTFGESLGIIFNISTTFNKPVGIFTGQRDAVTCSLENPEDPPDCGQGSDDSVAAFKQYYPAVPDNKFTSYQQPDAGHSLQIHRTAPFGFMHAHKFLARQGL